jgi:Cu2+-exporting ATPase
MISGEPIPLDKKTDDTVVQVQLKINRFVIAEKLVQKPCFRKLCKWLIQSSRAPIQNGDRIAKVFCVPIVVAVSIITFFLGQNWSSHSLWIH